MSLRITRSKTRDAKKELVMKQGCYVWAKIDGKFWAAIIVSHTDLGFAPAANGKSWIFWFGDHKVSQIRHSLMKDFCEHYKTSFTSSHRKYMSSDWILGVFEAIREIGLPETETLSKKELVLWATKLSDGYRQKYVVTDFVKGKLDAIRKLNVRRPPDAVKESANYKIRQMIEKYQAGKIRTLSFCLGCYSDKRSDEHPMFLGYFCIDCKERYKKNYYKINESGKKAFCVICGLSGVMIVCKEDECKFVYCTQCIQDLGSPGASKILRKKTDWFCFICHENKQYQGALAGKRYWKHNIEALFSHKEKSSVARTYKKEVVTLNSDDIRSVLTAIATLGDAIGIYYVTTMNDDITKISKQNYPEIIDFFSSTKQLTAEEYQKIPINLLTCTQRDKARNGIKCPTIILYEFYRVLNSLRVYNTSVFWLFAWTADISLQSQVIVTRLLQYHPILVENCAAMDKQLVWSNLPSEATDTEVCQNILSTDPYSYNI